MLLFSCSEGLICEQTATPRLRRNPPAILGTGTVFGDHHRRQQDAAKSGTTTKRTTSLSISPSSITSATTTPLLFGRRVISRPGFTPVTLSDQYLKTLDIMLIPDKPGFSFVDARWDPARVLYPFLGSDVDNATGAARYDNLLDQTPKSLACLLNISEAMSQIALSQGTPLDYIKQLRWDAPYAPAQDRFYAWCDSRLIDQVKNAAAAGEFAVENNPGLFHPGATSSWKQIQFGEANVQLTFHENDTMIIGGVDCVMVEPDIDYYQDLAAHALLEVIANALTHSLTDPTEVYVLRWIAGRTAGIPEFAPIYTITS